MTKFFEYKAWDAATGRTDGIRRAVNVEYITGLQEGADGHAELSIATGNQHGGVSVTIEQTYEETLAYLQSSTKKIDIPCEKCAGYLDNYFV